MEAFELNSKIELIKDDEESFSGLIYDIGDDKLYVSVSGDDKDFKILYEEESIEGVVYLEDEVVGFNCIISRRIYDGRPLYELSNLSDLYKIQRRKNVRIPYTREIPYTSDKELIGRIDRLEDPDEISFNMYYKFSRGMILDISGGGVKLSCNEDLQVKDHLYLRLDLGSKRVVAKGEIVHKTINRRDGRTKYIYGIKFINLPEKTREEVIRFVFILMRRNLLKK